MHHRAGPFSRPIPLQLFGSPRRTEVLILLALLEETNSSELSRYLGAPLFSVQRIIRALTRDGIVEDRPVTRIRRLRLDRRLPAYEELRALLLRLGTENLYMRALADYMRDSRYNR